MMDTKIKYVIAGRLKRLKSIMRKLKRPSSYNMDLSRMSDIAATRIIVESATNQNTLVNEINKTFRIEKIKDYRDESNLYRAVHMYIRDEENNLLELQLRTLLQQLWADESESFGEQSKQLNYDFYSANVKRYLKNLSIHIYNLENNLNLNNELFINDEVFKERSPLDRKYNRIEKLFKKYHLQDIKNMFYIIVFDNSTLELISEYEFFVEEKELAMDKFNKLNYDLGKKDIYDIIFLNTDLGKDILKITHPRFFI